jgi:hypothetical protein
MDPLKKICLVLGIIILAYVLILLLAHFTHDTSACTRCSAVTPGTTPPVSLAPGNGRTTPATVPVTPQVGCTGAETCPLPATGQASSR